MKIPALLAPLRLTRRVAIVSLFSLLQPAFADPAGPSVAAAASLRHALPIIAEAFGALGHPTPRLSFGSSGNLYRQIRQGAPYELFLSADESYVLALAGDGLTLDGSAVYASGRLALLVGRSGRVDADPTLADLRAAIRDGRLRRFAIPNPEHAPYGRAAKAVLVAASLWEAMGPRLLMGENAAQAAQFVIAGGADGALVPFALVSSLALESGERVAALEPGTHPPLVHRMALLSSAGETARAFHDYLLGAPARAVFERFGLAPDRPAPE